MLPRITKISRLRRHPTDQTLSIVQVFGCEHRAVVVYRNAATGAPTSLPSAQWYVHQKVLFLPTDVFLSENVAVALGVADHCRSASEQEEEERAHRAPRTTSTRRAIVKIVAVDYNGVVSHGAIVPFEHAVKALGIQQSRLTNVDAVEDNVLFALRPPLPQKYKARTEPLVDLLHNPSLLNALLETPVWMSELIRGQRVALQYDACNDVVRYWDESHVLAPHGWWTMPNRDGAKELPPSLLPLLTQFSEALQRIGRQRYGKAVDLYLRGVISTRRAMSGGEQSSGEGKEKIYFYECALHGARSFVLGAEQFLRMCEASRFPRMPTLYTNRTLRSIINERLGRRRVLLAPTDISFVAPSSASALPPGGAGGGGGRYSHRFFSSQHRPHRAVEEKSEESDDKVQMKHAYDYYAKSAPSTNLLSSASLSNSPTASLSLSGGRGNSFGSRNRRVTAGAAEASGSWRRKTPIDDETAVEENEFDSEWFGGVSKDRVDWAQCLLLIANQLHERVPSSTGLAIQVYSGSDLLRIVEKFKYMRSRVGAQIVCEQSLLEK